MPCEDLIPGSKPTPERSIRCCICGHWITRMEYGGVINGSYIDFTNKTCGTMVLTMCSECTEKVLTYMGEEET